MSKKTREEKREEERRIIAEMDEALQEKAESENVQNASQASRESGESAPKASPTPKTDKNKNRYHCPRCRTLLEEDGKCPTCGYKMYIPMDEKKRNKIRLIVAAVCIAVFIVLFVILQFQK